MKSTDFMPAQQFFFQQRQVVTAIAFFLLNRLKQLALQHNTDPE